MHDSGHQTPLPLHWNHLAIAAAAHSIGVNDLAEFLGAPLASEPSHAEMSLLVALLPIGFADTCTRVSVDSI